MCLLVAACSNQSEPTDGNSGSATQGNAGNTSVAAANGGSGGARLGDAGRAANVASAGTIAPSSTGSAGRNAASSAGSAAGTKGGAGIGEPRAPSGGALAATAGAAVPAGINTAAGFVNLAPTLGLFYSSGLMNCASVTTADPTTITLGQIDETVYMPGADYSAGLTEIRTKYADSGKFATYYLGGANQTFHQHIWRSRFYAASPGGPSIAQWVSKLLDGTIEQVGRSSTAAALTR